MSSHVLPNPCPINFVNNGMPCFLGLWFEIARLYVPLAGTDSTIEFSQPRHGVVIVRTSKRIWGMPTKSSHKALILNPLMNSKFYFTRGAVRNWWILRTDCDFYALIGSPNRKRLHIYARHTTLDPEVLNHLIKIAKGMGYDTSGLLLTKHHLAGNEVATSPVYEYMLEDDDY